MAQTDTLPMPPAVAWGYAAQWGSFLKGGDPGACMYGFDERFVVQHEAHRTECLAWIEGCRVDVRATPAEFEPDELARLDALEAAVRAAITEDQLQAREDRLDAFTRAYITAALWSSMDNADDTGGSPLDANFGIAQLSDETFAGMVEECKAFQQAHRATLDRCGGDASQAGHDFWLTRCGHGTGFWDRDDAVWDKAARDTLTEAAKACGEVDLYVGDDGKIYEM